MAAALRVERPVRGDRAALYLVELEPASVSEMLENLPVFHRYRYYSVFHHRFVLRFRICLCI